MPRAKAARPSAMVSAVPSEPAAASALDPAAD